MGGQLQSCTNAAPHLEALASGPSQWPAYQQTGQVFPFLLQTSTQIFSSFSSFSSTTLKALGFTSMPRCTSSGEYLATSDGTVLDCGKPLLCHKQGLGHSISQYSSGLCLLETFPFFPLMAWNKDALERASIFCALPNSFGSFSTLFVVLYDIPTLVCMVILPSITTTQLTDKNSSFHLKEYCLKEPTSFIHNVYSTRIHHRFRRSRPNFCCCWHCLYIWQENPRQASCTSTGH